MNCDIRKIEGPGKRGSVNRVMVAAAKSHSGKTLITCGLLEILRRRGLDPASFKCGPDYIDPMFHETVLGIECKNLDTFFVGKTGVRDLVAQCRHHYALIEGVMGLYDGTDVGSTAGSSYEVAAATKTPIILIVDASGIGRTVISMIKGILGDDTEHLIRGLILNRCSAGYYMKLQPVLGSELQRSGYPVRVLGTVPPAEDIRLESRHLGLKLPGEVEDIREKIHLAADLLEEHVDIEGVLELMEEAGRKTLVPAVPMPQIPISAAPVPQIPFPSALVPGMTFSAVPVPETPFPASVPVPEMLSTGKTLTLAVARDEAFCFYYKENLEMFERRGVKIQWFSPLHDRQLPKDVDGLLLGGGYPEYYLRELSQNTFMLESIKEAIDQGMPSLAECGGFMYLHRTVADMDGNCFKMAGVIDGECRYTGHLVRFGYLQIENLNISGQTGDGSAGETGDGYTEEIRDGFNGESCIRFLESLVGMKGHEFHYYDSSCSGETYTAGKPYRNVRWNCMITRNNGIWGFPHFYYGSNPGFLEAFIARMRTVT